MSPGGTVVERWMRSVNCSRWTMYVGNEGQGEGDIQTTEHMDILSQLLTIGGPIYFTLTITMYVL